MLIFLFIIQVMIKNQNGFGTIEILIVSTLTIIIFISGWYIWRLNQPSTENNNVTSTQETEIKKDKTNPNSAPEYNDWPTVDFIIGGTKTGNSYEPITLALENCPYGTDSVYFGFGHTVFAIEGKSDNQCIFWYGTEIENPNWDGKLQTKCIVPTNVVTRLSLTNTGIDFSTIEQYCSNIS
jgi:hypothetical protein